MYYLATPENGAPRVRPFGTAHIFDGKLCLQTGLKKDVAKQLLADPRAELCAFKDGTWLRLRGRLLPDYRVEAIKSMLDAYPELRAMYDEHDGNAIVFFFEDAEATFSSFTMPPRTVRF